MAGPNGSSHIAETSRVGPSFESLPTAVLPVESAASRRAAPPLRPAAPPRLVRPPLLGNSYARPRARVHRQTTSRPDASRSATVASVIGAAAPVTGSTKCRPRVAEYTECMARCRASAQSQPPRGAGGPQLPPLPPCVQRYATARPPARLRAT
eukprot:CAMPEP_0119468698 /NCGR_PEP_ID=MMETSP1344-20130328/2335_1 /TAXON_ID=236787 /ORGANISM="Florenciella parvula, Strain CCMP2471" /LENGTH=152 /DNA_ID=CAMNT_0007501187 /DNA_START=280 /DNA_END=736 /DNA_ORIENTATION=+